MTENFFISLGPPPPPLGAQVTTIIVEHTSIVMTFAFSKQVLWDIYQREYHGHCETVWRAFFGLPELKATRAIIELAVMWRALDDTQGLIESLRDFEVGRLYPSAGEPKPLRFRDMTNKIIHAHEMRWNFENPDNPLLICVASAGDVEKFGWSQAEISVKGIGAACSWLG